MAGIPVPDGILYPPGSGEEPTFVGPRRQQFQAGKGAQELLDERVAGDPSIARDCGLDLLAPPEDIKTNLRGFLERNSVEDIPWFMRVITRAEEGPPRMVFRLQDRRAIVSKPLGKGGVGSTYLLRFLDPPGTQDRAVLKVGSVEKTGDTSRAEQRLNGFENEHTALELLGDSAGPPERFTNGNWLQYCLFMRYYQGTPLNERLKQAGGRLPPVQALRLILAVAEKLEMVFTKKGLTHHDLKPENMIVDDQDDPHLVDWGASATEEYGTRDPEELDRAHKEQVTTQFSPSTAAPEQYQNRASMQSQVYALGLLLLRFLNGKIPMEAIGVPAGRNPVEAMQAAHSRSLYSLLHQSASAGGVSFIDQAMRHIPSAQGTTQLRSMVEQMMHNDPTQRMSMRRVIDTLRTICQELES